MASVVPLERGLWEVKPEALVEAVLKRLGEALKEAQAVRTEVAEASTVSEGGGVGVTTGEAVESMLPLMIEEGVSEDHPVGLEATEKEGKGEAVCESCALTLACTERVTGLLGLALGVLIKLGVGCED